jgi:biopolymer transport protein ExbB/TolQ
MLQQLWHHFQLGGWMMWVIFALGLPGVGAAGRFAWRGEHQLLASLRWLCVTLLASGAFGFFVGEQRVLHAMLHRLGEFTASDQALSDRRAALLIEGTSEALNCVTGALFFVISIGLLVTIGQRRFPLPNPAAVPR